MRAVAGALCAGYGVFLVYTARALGWSGLRPGPGPARPAAARWRARLRAWLVTTAGPDEANPVQLLGAMAVLFVVATASVYVVLGGLAPALAVGGFAATFPPVSARTRRRRRRAEAAEAWPRMIEELALLSGSMGRSVPQALFEVGRRAPPDLRPAFEDAQREWLLTTDFARTVAVLKDRLADPTADATCETLLVAHEVGGADLDRRLAALVEDRAADVQGRKDARAKQAGVRFARRFVLFVPAGMALSGLSIGQGRDAFRTAAGQAASVLAVAVVVACWAWAGRIMRLPEEARVFAPSGPGDGGPA